MSVGIEMVLNVRMADTYFQSEVRRALQDALGTRPGGFFERGRLRFGEDLHASDVFQALMSFDGVENVSFARLKRVGGQYEDRSAIGVIPLEGLEIAVCDNDSRDSSRGFYRLSLHGGRPG